MERRKEHKLLIAQSALLLLICISAGASPLPTAFSPGSVTRLEQIDLVYPTFNWGGSREANGYEVLIEPPR